MAASVLLDNVLDRNLQSAVGIDMKPELGCQCSQPALTAAGILRSRTPGPLLSCPLSSLQTLFAPRHEPFQGNGARSCPDSSADTAVFSRPCVLGDPGKINITGVQRMDRQPIRMPAHANIPFPVCSRCKASPAIMPYRKILTVPKATQIL